MFDITELVAKLEKLAVCCDVITAKGEPCGALCAKGLNTCRKHNFTLCECGQKCLRSKTFCKSCDPTKVKCQALTAKGTVCGALVTKGVYCIRHVNYEVKVVKEKKQKVKKPEKIQLVHNHLPDEKPLNDCLMCKEHGDIFDINVIDRCYEIV